MYKLSLISTALVTKALALSSSNFVILDENLPKNNNAAKKQQPAKRGLAGLVAKPRGMADSTKRNKPQQVQGFMKSRRAENKDKENVIPFAIPKPLQKPGTPQAKQVLKQKTQQKQQQQAVPKLQVPLCSPRAASDSPYASPGQSPSASPRTQSGSSSRRGSAKKSSRSRSNTPRKIKFQKKLPEIEALQENEKLGDKQQKQHLLFVDSINTGRKNCDQALEHGERYIPTSYNDNESVWAGLKVVRDKLFLVEETEKYKINTPVGNGDEFEKRVIADKAVFVLPNYMSSDSFECYDRDELLHNSDQFNKADLSFEDLLTKINESKRPVIVVWVSCDSNGATHDMDDFTVLALAKMSNSLLLTSDDYSKFDSKLQEFDLGTVQRAKYDDFFQVKLNDKDNESKYFGSFDLNKEMAKWIGKNGNGELTKFWLDSNFKKTKTSSTWKPQSNGGCTIEDPAKRKRGSVSYDESDDDWGKCVVMTGSCSGYESSDVGAGAGVDVAQVEKSEEEIEIEPPMAFNSPSSKKGRTPSKKDQQKKKKQEEDDFEKELADHQAKWLEAQERVPFRALNVNQVNLVSVA